MKIFLHVCCGVCASSVAERLMCEGHTVTGYFYNPNIHPVDEYQKRLGVAVRASKELGFELVEGPYDRERWFERMKGKEYEPEGGARCRECYAMRLERTWQMCRKGNYDLFATTLTVSPHKDAVVINEIGRALGGEKFICADFKKKNGFIRANELAKEWGVYRQHYCGCIYSLERSLAEEKAKAGEKEK